MPILNIQTSSVGQVGVVPSIAYISTNDTLAQVTATGYLNQAVQNGASLNESSMCLVSTKTSPSAADVQVGWLEVSHVGANWSLVPTGAPGTVVLPTIANHLATYTNTTGTLSEDASTAINGGNIQAGLSGTAGYLASFPSAASKGSLRLTAVANTGDTLVTISNALHGQASVYSIPDCGASTANLLVSKLTGTQHITVGAFQVDAGVISSGISTGGSAGGFIAYPATTTTGSLRLTPVGNVGNFASTISDVTGLGQASTYTLPDPGNANARILVGATATPFTTGRLLASSGTGGLVVDSGVATTNVQLKTDVKAGTTGNIGGAGAGPITVTVAGLTAASVVVATIATSSNTVSVAKAVAGTGNFDVLFSGDPGATCTLNYVAYIVGQ